MITDECKDWIVFLNIPTGFTGIQNVFLVRARDSKQAKNMSMRITGSIEPNHFKVFDLSELPDGWSYYK